MRLQILFTHYKKKVWQWNNIMKTNCVMYKKTCNFDNLISVNKNFILLNSLFANH